MLASRGPAPYAQAEDLRQGTRIEDQSQRSALDNTQPSLDIRLRTLRNPMSQFGCAEATVTSREMRTEYMSRTSRFSCGASGTVHSMIPGRSLTSR